MAKAALIVGAGDGISACWRSCSPGEGIEVGLAARKIGKLGALTDEIGAVLPFAAMPPLRTGRAAVRRSG